MRRACCWSQQATATVVMLREPLGSHGTHYERDTRTEQTFLLEKSETFAGALVHAREGLWLDGWNAIHRRQCLLRGALEAQFALALQRHLASIREYHRACMWHEIVNGHLTSWRK